MKKLVYLTLVALFACMLVSCAGMTPKLVKPGGKIGDMTVQDQSKTTLPIPPVLRAYCGDYFEGTEPGTHTTDCDVPLSSSILIDFGWGAKDSATFDSNWSAMKWEMYIDGHQINLDQFRQSTGRGISESGVSQIGRSWVIELVNLSPGKHTLRLLWKSEKPIDDGFNIYPAGTYESIKNFTVAEK
jgi:hypothetical protein